MIARVLICAAIGMGLSVRAAADDCQFGWSVQGPIPGLNDIVFKSVAWDPDGAGPEPETIVAFGNFNRAGDQPVPNTAILRNGAWGPLGQIRGEPDGVVVHNGELYVSGIFQVQVAGSLVNRPLLKWDGAAWQVVSPDPPLTAGYYGSLLSHSGRLYVGGGISPNRFGVSVFDGTSWQLLGPTSRIGRIALFQGALLGVTQVTIDGSTRGAIARWDGSAWQTIGVSDPTGSPAMIAANADSVFISGGFQSISGVPAARIARWDGVNWHALGSGLTSPSSGVQDMTIFQGQLVIGGTFHDIGGNTLADKLARWDGSAWREMVPGSQPSIRTIAPIGSRLFVGGSFESLQNVTALNAAFWENGQSQPTVVGLTSSIRSIVRETPNELIISGTHTLSGLKPFPVLTRVDGRWNWVGSATCASSTRVNALRRFDGALVAAGEFQQINGQDLGDLVYFDGTQWQPLGQRLLGTVKRLAIFNGRLLAAGNFQIEGGDGTGDLAAWDGLQWRGLDLAAGSSIEDIYVHSGRVYAVGDIRIGADPTVQRVAYWDGQSWTSLTGNMLSAPWAVAVYEDEVYIGGQFSAMDPTYPRYFARWDGNAWRPVVSEIAGLGAAYGLEVFNGLLFVLIGGSSEAYVRTWDGQTWSDAYGGSSDGRIPSVTPYDLAKTATEIYAVGFGNFNLTIGPCIFLRYAPTSGQWTDCNLNQVLDGCDISRDNSLDDDQNGVPDECQTPFVAGDMDCDGFLTIGDIGGFVLALTNPAQYAVQFPGCDIARADMNNDTFVNVGDVGAFVLALTGG